VPTQAQKRPTPCARSAAQSIRLDGEPFSGRGHIGMVLPSRGPFIT
jgi:hypothetical protein